MKILFLSFLIFLINIGSYIYGYKNGFLDGCLIGRWRVKNDRNNFKYKTNSNNTQN